MMRAFVALVLAVAVASAMDLARRDALLQGSYSDVLNIYYKLKELGKGLVGGGGASSGEGVLVVWV